MAPQAQGKAFLPPQMLGALQLLEECDAHFRKEGGETQQGHHHPGSKQWSEPRHIQRHSLLLRLYKAGPRSSGSFRGYGLLIPDINIINYY